MIKTTRHKLVSRTERDVEVKRLGKVSSWYKLMGGLYMISLLAAIPGSLGFLGLMLRGIGFKDWIYF